MRSRPTAQHAASGVGSTLKCASTDRLDRQNPSSTAKNGRHLGGWTAWRSAIVPHPEPTPERAKQNIKTSNITSKSGPRAPAPALEHVEMCARRRAFGPCCTQRVTPSAPRWEREGVGVVRRVPRPYMGLAAHRARDSTHVPGSTSKCAAAGSAAVFVVAMSQLGQLRV
jgi:hypothetical protein